MCPGIPAKIAIAVKATMEKTLYIIDGHYQIYRAFYAPFRDLTSPSGEPTKATHVFCQMLAGLIRERRPDYLAVVMDTSDETVFRCEIDPAYKANREPPPDDFHIQADRIVSIIETIGIPLFRLPGFEADDIAATIAERLKSDDIETFLVSRDKDLEQLLSDRVRLYDPTRDEVIDPEVLQTRKGYSPAEAVEIQTLTGDPTDNVPGIKGVGPKTAVKLIRKYGSVEGVLAHCDELTPKLRENVRAFADRLETTRRLVTLRRDVPVDFELEACALERFRLDRALPIFDELGFNRIRDQWRELALVKPDTAPDEDKPSPGAMPQSLFDMSPAKTDVPGPEHCYELVDTVEALDAFL